MANVLTLTGYSRLSIGGDYLCYLAKASTPDNYATAGMTITTSGMQIGTVKGLVGLRGSVNAVACDWVYDPTSGNILAFLLTAETTGGNNGSAITFAADGLCLVFGKE